MGRAIMVGLQNTPDWLGRAQPAGSFCRCGENKIGRLVAGATGYICDSCIAARIGVLWEKWRI
jgi:hypothetical protein